VAVKVQVIFYSTHGHVFRQAGAVAEGAREGAGVHVGLLRVAETLPPEVLEKMGATGERQPTANELAIARSQGRHVATIAAKLAAK
jgi:NAD(P)H dehydrogenase (quinone)